MTDEKWAQQPLPLVLANAVDSPWIQKEGLPEATNLALRVLRLPQVCAVTGLKRSMIYQLESQQRFPHRIRIGIRAVGWIEHEVCTWVATRIAESRTVHKRQF